MARTPELVTRWMLVAALGWAVLGQSTRLRAQEQATPEDSIISLGLNPVLGLDPTVPQTGALPGGVTPAYGQRSATEQDWRFDFHGFLTAPLRAGINTRDEPTDGQSETVLHAPPIVPDDLETFSHTGVVPTPYAQLNFSYSNSLVSGNISIVARQANVATGFFDPPSQLGVNDLYLAITPQPSRRALFKVFVGAFSNRYGVSGEYDEGRYGTPLIARTNGVGENAIGTFDLGDFALLVEQGIQGQTNKAPAGITPDGWNDFADPNVGTGFVNHVHAGLSYRGLATLGAHYMTAWSKDDRATGATLPDGTINVLATDLRLSLGRFGHFYAAFSHTSADDARTVGRIIEVLNTRGGPGLIQNYLGPESGGNGTLATIGGQYDLSLGRLLSYPVPFNADGPDIVLSLFGIRTRVNSDDPDFDNVTKRKVGFEATYGVLSWLALSGRYDQVDPDVSNKRFSFAVLSPRLIFHTDWTSRDQVVLQYSRWFNGSLTTVRTGYPPIDDPTAVPDEHMISLSASMWW